jgi:hypothetical protein
VGLERKEGKLQRQVVQTEEVVSSFPTPLLSDHSEEYS